MATSCIGSFLLAHVVACSRVLGVLSGFAGVFFRVSPASAHVSCTIHRNHTRRHVCSMCAWVVARATFPTPLVQIHMEENREREELGRQLRRPTATHGRAWRRASSSASCASASPPNEGPDASCLTLSKLSARGVQEFAAVSPGRGGPAACRQDAVYRNSGSSHSVATHRCDEDSMAQSNLRKIRRATHRLLLHRQHEQNEGDEGNVARPGDGSAQSRVLGRAIAQNSPLESVLSAPTATIVQSACRVDTHTHTSSCSGRLPRGGEHSLPRAAFKQQGARCSPHTCQPQTRTARNRWVGLGGASSSGDL